MFGKEYTEVISIYLAVGVLVNHSEDREDGVVETTDQLLFEELNSLKALNFPMTTMLQFSLN